MTESEIILKMIEVPIQDAITWYPEKLIVLAPDLHRAITDLLPNWQHLVPNHCFSAIPSNLRDSTKEEHWRILVFLFSRDALKAIRPDCYHFVIYGRLDNDVLKPFGTRRGYYCEAIEMDARKSALIRSAWRLVTEELAEFHAIIQVIDYERHRSEANGTR